MPSPLGTCKLCELGDFSDPELRDLIREVYSSERERQGPGFPAGREYRKHWEIAMAIRALDAGGALREDARILGVGAGTEATIFWLTNRVERVVATDLYATRDHWSNAGTDPEMLTDPGRFWDGPWAPERLEVLHMNALALEFDDESFDGVFSSGSIEHFGNYADVRRGVEEIFRVLRPGGVATLSTEFRLEGPPPGIPGALLFNEPELRSILLDGLRWDPLNPLDLTIDAETRATEFPLEEAVAEKGAGADSAKHFPHIVLDHDETVFTSVHVALVKSKLPAERPTVQPASLPPLVAATRALPELRGSAPPPQAASDPLSVAREAVRGEPSTTWDAPSRLGPVGRFLRRVLWRILRPYDVRRREVEASLIRAIDQEGPLRSEAAIVPDPIVGKDVTEVDTPLGSFLLDRNDALIRPELEVHKSWSYDVASLLERSLEPGMRFLDIGANFGYFSVLGSRLVGPSGWVIAVEPDPANLELLRANLWRNGCSNARVLPVAGDSRRGHVPLVIFPEGGGATEVTRDASLYEDDARVDVEDIGRILAPSTRLDDLVIPPVDVMKLDAQFAEPEIIEGLQETIAVSPSLVIVTEFGPRELRRRSHDPVAILNRWAGLGFDINLLQGTEEVFMDFEEIASAPNNMPLGNGPFFDLVLRRSPT